MLDLRGLADLSQDWGNEDSEQRRELETQVLPTVEATPGLGPRLQTQDPQLCPVLRGQKMSLWMSCQTYLRVTSYLVLNLTNSVP